MNRVGVLGGTFDPPHLGHLRGAEAALDALDLDHVLFVPASEPPHKSDLEVTPSTHRERMVEAALQGLDRFQLCRIELERGGPSYTIETLEELKRRTPETVFFFVTGSDAFREIRTWMRWEELLATYSFVVHERPGDDLDSATAVVPETLRHRVVAAESKQSGGLDGRIVLLRRPMLFISSTELRGAVRRGESVRFLVPDAVTDYIRQNRLYTE